MAGDDEALEIVFWWLDSKDDASIEEELDAYLEPKRPHRRRRLPWPGRRTAATL